MKIINNTIKNIIFSEVIYIFLEKQIKFFINFIYNNKILYKFKNSLFSIK